LFPTIIPSLFSSTLPAPSLLPFSHP
jgi:hypothetical protein